MVFKKKKKKKMCTNTCNRAAASYVIYSTSLAHTSNFWLVEFHRFILCDARHAQETTVSKAI